MPNRLLLATLLASAAPVAPAATLVWPDSGGGVCAGSLQACLDSAADGDTVMIGPDDAGLPDAYTAIAEPLTVRRSLTLAAQHGIDAVVAPGFSIVIEPDVPGPHQVTLSGLVLRQGSVDIRDGGSVAGSVFRIERLRIAEPAPTNAISCAINAQLGSPSPQLIVGDNVVNAGSAAGESRSGICAYATDPAIAYTANVFRNRIEAGAATLRFGIALNAPSGGGSLVVSANTILGPRLVDGISVQRAEGTAAQSVQIDNNVVALQDEATGWGIRAEVGNTTAAVVNNSVVHGQRGLRVSGFDALPTSGRVANNLVAYHAITGLSLSGDVGNGHNLVFRNTTDSFTPGPSTLTLNPRIEQPGHPRPASLSPAFDAGNASDLPPLALFDADGERRIAFGTVDIGAYEITGDGAEVIVATPETAGFNEIYVAPFPTAPSAADVVVGVARSGAGAGGVSALNLGAYYNPASPSGWSLFLQQSLLSIPMGSTFHALAPYLGKSGILHTTTSGSVSGSRSVIDDVELNGALNRSRIALAFHRWDGLYHDVPISLSWVSSGGGRWQVRNEDGAAMPEGLTFSIAAAPVLSPNAFRATLDAFARPQWRLQHPLLDGNPCAAPVVGRADDPDLAGDALNPVAFGAAYEAPSGDGAPGRWVVRADATAGSPTFPAGAAFHVLIDGAQVNRCRAPRLDALFADGYE